MEPTDLDHALEAARRADQWAISCLFRAFHPQLLRYLRHHAPDVADDLASETWLATAKGLAGFDGDAREFRAWLFTIARRRVVDHYRAHARRARLDEGRATSSAPAPDETGTAVVDAMTSQEAIDALVRDLSPDQAQVVLLRVVADLSVEEVARIMKRTPGSVRVLQHRALQRLGRTWDRGAVTR